MELELVEKLGRQDVMLVLSRVYHLGVASIEQHVGIPVPRWRLLFLLHVHGPCTQKDLQGMINIDAASITRPLKTLEKHGFVRREDDAADNRRTRVSLTRAGAAAVRKGMKRRREFLMSMLKGLGREEIAGLMTALTHIEGNLRGGGASLTSATWLVDAASEDARSVA